MGRRSEATCTDSKYNYCKDEICAMVACVHIELKSENASTLHKRCVFFVKERDTNKPCEGLRLRHSGRASTQSPLSHHRSPLHPTFPRAPARAPDAGEETLRTVARLPSCRQRFQLLQLQLRQLLLRRRGGWTAQCCCARRSRRRGPSPSLGKQWRRAPLETLACGRSTPLWARSPTEASPTGRRKRPEQHRRRQASIHRKSRSIIGKE